MQAVTDTLKAAGEAIGSPLMPNTQRSGPNLGGTTVRAPGATVTSVKDPEKTHLAACWHGKKDVVIEERLRPHVTDPHDVVLKVTSSCICGSDLHLYHGTFAGMERGDILGHEFMGIVTEKGDAVTKHQIGDRVVACFDIACGDCWYCKQGLFSSCATTNASKAMPKMYGDCCAGFFGYTHLTGGYEGGQAQYVRVPYGDVGLLHVPDEIPDLKAVFLSDVLPTAWWANEAAGVGKGDNVAIWGAGPVGLLAAQCAMHRGAERVVLIDSEEERLRYARNKLAGPGLHTVNFKKQSTKEALKELLPLGAPDCCIDAVGQHYTHTVLHTIETALGLETDSPEVLNDMILCCRKGGRIGLIGAYAAYANHVNIGGFMEKGLTMTGGQTSVQRYWHELLEKVKSGALDPSIIVTHVRPLTDAPKMYDIFDKKTDGCVKVVLKPWAEEQHPSERAMEKEGGKVQGGGGGMTEQGAAHAPHEQQQPQQHGGGGERKHAAGVPPAPTAHAVDTAAKSADEGSRLGTLHQKA